MEGLNEDSEFGLDVLEVDDLGGGEASGIPDSLYSYTEPRKPSLKNATVPASFNFNHKDEVRKLLEVRRPSKSCPALPCCTSHFYPWLCGVTLTRRKRAFTRSA